MIAKPRHLTLVEQEEIISACLEQYRTIANLPPVMRARFEDEFRVLLRKEFENVELVPNAFQLFKSEVIRKYRLVDPAKSVGIICGQSIGEMQTQTTLNTFHKTGLTEKLVVAGVPRFLEIIDTNRSETQGTPSAYIFFKSPPQTIAEARERVNSTLVHFTFGKLIENFVVETDSLKYELNLGLLFRYKIHLNYIAQQLVKEFPEYLFEASPLHEGIVKVRFQSVIATNELEDRIHPQLCQSRICGIERIQNIFFLRSSRDNSWYLETDGSNLEAILNLPFVDTYQTYSNDIWEIYVLFGIEAVRTYIVEELVQLMPTIHSSHISLLADRMTVSGRLRSISRYTRKHEQSSVLSKATFEETLTGFLRSAIMKEVDTVNGSSASIICGKIPKVGSGMNDLVI